MLTITYNEIKERCRGLYWDDGQIVTKHNVYKGEKEFAKCIIANILALLERDNIKDDFIISYLQLLIGLSNKDSKQYKEFLNIMGTEKDTIVTALEGEKLSIYERKLLGELMLSNLSEYTMKGDYQKCCYSAMKVFFITASDSSTSTNVRGVLHSTLLSITSFIRFLMPMPGGR